MNRDTVLVLGARSDIALSVARRFAKSGYNIQLAARCVDNLNAEKSDLEIRFQVTVSLHEFDALDIAAHESFVVALPKLPTVAICAVGFMGNQVQSERDLQTATQVMRSNFEGPASIIGVLANHFEKRGSGCIVGISSVAGERGRAKNYVYGSAKAGFTAFLSGLRNRLSNKDVHVLTVLPGFVATKMTVGMDLPFWLTANPDELANKIYTAVKNRKNVAYYKPIWFLLMMIIRYIPEFIFKKVNL